MSEEWKPCPFCGGPGQLASGGEVVCMTDGCPCYMPAELWNRRTPGPETEKMIQRVRQALMAAKPGWGFNVALWESDVAGFLEEWGVKTDGNPR